jgi:hypothetical protein
MQTTPSPTPIPDDRLHSKISAIPFPPNADPRTNITVVVAGESGREFLTTIEPEEIIAFYRERLIPEGWTPEGEPVFESSPQIEHTSVRWSLIKGDVRLMLAAQVFPRGPSGDMAWTMRLQPAWYSGWDSGRTSTPPYTNTPIPIGPGYIDENGEAQY